jgi:transposase
MKDENAQSERPKGRKRRIHSREFKLQALEQVADGSSVAEVARQLGIHPSMLRRWRAQLANEAETPPARPPDRSSAEPEILRLRRELERVTRERDAATASRSRAPGRWGRPGRRPIERP